MSRPRRRGDSEGDYDDCLQQWLGNHHCASKPPQMSMASDSSRASGRGFLGPEEIRIVIGLVDTAVEIYMDRRDRLP